MTAHVLISGQLFREPEQRISKAGKFFVTVTIRAKDGETSQWWKVLDFSETTQAELMRLINGDGGQNGAPPTRSKKSIIQRTQ